MSDSSVQNRPPLSLSIRVFLDKRIIVIFFLGVSQGFPWFIASTALNIWLQEQGISRSEIGLAGALFLAYSINFLWSPLIDRFNFGFIGKRFGERKTWIMCMQAIIALCCFAASQLSPTANLTPLMLVMMAVTISAATHDIAIDAFRIDLIAPEETEHLSAAASTVTAGWFTGYAALGFFPLWISDSPNWDWPQIYPLLGLIMLGLMIPLLLCTEPKTNRQRAQSSIKDGYEKILAQQTAIVNWQLIVLTFAVPLIAILAIVDNLFTFSAWTNSGFYIPSVVLLELVIITYVLRLLWLASNTTQSQEPSKTSQLHTFLAWLLVSVIEPLKLFFDKNGVRFAITVLLFIFLFKIGEAYLGKMSLVFYKEVGFSNTDIAFYSKLLTWFVTAITAVVGGFINIRYGVVKGLFISGVAMAATNLLFSVIAEVGPNKQLFFFTIVTDGVTQAWSLMTFVAFVSLMCDRTFSASQYALMASLAGLGRTLVASTSGYAVDGLNGNWTLFFILTALMVIPSLLILVKIGPQITRIETENANMPAPASQ